MAIFVKQVQNPVFTFFVHFTNIDMNIDMKAVVY